MPESPTKTPSGRGGRRAGAGGKSKIDLSEVERLCAIACTDREIADFLQITRRGLAKRKASNKRLEYTYSVKTDAGKIERTEFLTFTEIMDRGKSRANISVRRRQFQLLEINENPAISIWLGKQLLGQHEPTQKVDAIIRSPREMTRDELLAWAAEIPDDDSLPTLTPDKPSDQE